MTHQFTRVVTAIDGSGRSSVVSAGAVQPLEPAPGFKLYEQWSCGSVSAAALGVDAPENPQFQAEPGPGGVQFRLVEFPPDPVGLMHRTATVDLVTVISGELVLAVEDGPEITLQPGDCVVQRGATHAWRNRGADPALAAVVLLGCQGPDGGESVEVAGGQ